MATRKLKATSVNKHEDDQDMRGIRRMHPKTVYIGGDAATIARLGRFLCECAKEMRSAGPFHRHFSHYLRDWDAKMLDVIIQRPL